MHQGALPHSSLVVCKATETNPESAAGRRSFNGGNYPPLPQPVCRKHTCRSHTVQVLSSHQRIHQPGKLNITYNRKLLSVYMAGHVGYVYSVITSRVILPHQEQLWSALKGGQIDMVVSDHSPCTPDLKKMDSGDFTQAWGGISSLQFGTDS